MAVTVEAVYDAATRGDVAAIDALLAELDGARRFRDPLTLTLRGARAVHTGDVAGGIVLLQRAAEDAGDPRLRAHVVDLLAAYLYSVGDVDGADAVLRSADDAVPELVPAYLAASAATAAYRGRREISRERAARALRDARRDDHPVILPRVLQRVALAALHREEFEEAQQRALEAAHASERTGNHRNVARAYQVLYSLAHFSIGDPDLTRLYAERMTVAAEAAGDVGSHVYGLIAQLEIATTGGEFERAASIRERVLAIPLAAQYRERFSYVFVEAMLHGRQRRYEAGAAILRAFVAAGAASLVESAACTALIALYDAARWDVESAKRAAHRVLSQTAHRPEGEPFYHALTRRVARIVAASACIIAGEAARGARALPRSVDPDGAFAALATQHHLDEDAVPPNLRGYAVLINLARDDAARSAPKLGLTRTELAVLHALPDGGTLEQIAANFGRSRKTIARHVGAIYEKLEVSNRAQAVQRARDLGIYASSSPGSGRNSAPASSGTGTPPAGRR